MQDSLTFSAVWNGGATRKNGSCLSFANDDLRTLAAARRNRAAFDGPLFTGWRGEIVGDSLRAAMAGELAVYWDPKRGVLAFRS